MIEVYQLSVGSKHSRYYKNLGQLLQMVKSLLVTTYPLDSRKEIKIMVLEMTEDEFAKLPVGW